VQVAAADLGLLDRFEIVVDHQAELGNVAPALARLLVEIERRRRAPTDAAANHSNHEVDA
jgi:hypothetical protein